MGYIVYAKDFDRKWLSLLFFSKEGNPLEPCHIHVRNHGALAKYWVGEKVMLADNIGFSAKELREIKSIIISNTNLIKEAWNGFSSK